MCTPLEHDYIGLSETSTMERSSENENNVLNLKETELRLGLPGSESPEWKAGPGVSIFATDFEENKTCGYSLNPTKNFVSGAKRGFSDAIDGSSKWALSVNGGSEVDLAKGSVLFSPRAGNGCSENKNMQKSSFLEFSMTEASIPPISKPVEKKKTSLANSPTAKAEVVGWPPIRSFRKNTLATNLSKNTDVVEGNSSSGCLYIKVSMDGAPYLRKVDLKTYSNYAQLSSALEKMFSCFTIGQCTSNGLPEQEGLSASSLMDLVHGSEYVLTYEDKDGDWMLVGDVPWDMFTASCKRLRIMKGSEAIGLAPRAMEKCYARTGTSMTYPKK